MSMKSSLKTSIISAAVALGVVAASAPSASAYIVCNRYRECWHSHARYAYPARFGVAFYPDTWRAGRGYRWVRDRDDRGYWRRGVWIRF